MGEGEVVMIVANMLTDVATIVNTVGLSSKVCKLFVGDTKLCCIFHSEIS